MNKPTLEHQIKTWAIGDDESFFVSTWGHPSPIISAFIDDLIDERKRLREAVKYAMDYMWSLGSLTHHGKMERILNPSEVKK